MKNIHWNHYTRLLYCQTAYYSHVYKLHQIIKYKQKSITIIYSTIHFSSPELFFVTQ